MALGVSLLGPVEASLDGRPVPLGPAKQRAVLALLALGAGTTVSIDALVEGLWGEQPPATAPKMVQLYVSQLRRLLGEAAIETQGRAYRLRVEPDAVDALRFASLVAAGRAAEALGLWRGAPLADVADTPFAMGEARRLEDLRLLAEEQSVDESLAAGHHAEVAGRLEQLVREHPLREGLHRRRMLALYRAGRQAEALEAFQEARRTLVDEVGIEPGPELRDLHERLLRQDPDLAAPAPAVPAPVRADPAPSAVASAPSAPRRGAATSRRWRAAVAGMAVAALGAFALTQVLGSDGLSGIEPGALGALDPESAEITAQFRLGASGGAVAGGAGSLWVAHPGEDAVSRLDAEDDRVLRIAAGPAPTGLAFAADALWVASEEDGSVTQVAAATNRVGQRLPAVGNGLRALTAAFGSVWAAAATDRAVVRIDPRAGRVRARIALAGTPVALAAGAGSLWAAAEDVGTVVRIDPRSAASVKAIPVGGGPAAVAFGAGAVWVANAQDGTVSRIDPRTERVTHTTPVGPEPVALAVVGEDVWVADRTGGLRRLDARTQDVTRQLRTGSGTAALAVVGDRLWASAVVPTAAHRGGTLRIAAPGPFRLDPAPGGFDGNSTPYLQLTHEGLLGYRRAGGAAASRLVPQLAADLPEVSAGGRRLRFRLRPGLRYADGSRVRASDFARSLARLPSRNRDVLGLYTSIVGFASCTASRCDLSRGIRADDAAGTIELRLVRPDRDLLHRLALPTAAFVSGRPGSPPAGTGPYRRVAGGTAGFALARNPHFRPRPGGRDAGFADRIEVRVAGDPGDEAARVARGTSDVYAPSLIAPHELSVIRARSGGRVRSGPAAAVGFAVLNTTRAPFDDVRVRRALNLAVDRAHVAQRMGAPDLVAPTCQLLPPGVTGYRPVCPFTARPTASGAWVAPDLDEARRLVRASGRAGTRIAVWTPPDREPAGLHLAAVLRELGFRAVVRDISHDGVFFEAATQDRDAAQIGVTGWIAEHPGPDRFLLDLVTCGANPSQLCDRELERAIHRAADGEAGEDAWGELERRIARRAPLVPLLSLRWTAVTAARVGNVQFHPLFGIVPDQAWVR